VWDLFVQGAPLAFRLDTLLMMSVGVLLGILVGALPGFTTTMALAILLPLSFFVNPLVGIPFLLAVTKGGIYGGSIPAILVSIPGTGASIATTFDGPALTKKGQSRKAMEMALFASAFGDTASSILTLFLIGPIALVAVKFGPPELAAVILLSLVVITASASGVFVKGLVMLGFGLFFGLMGQDPLGGASRFTFDFFQLRSGIPLLPMLIGVFALPEVFEAIERKGASFVENVPAREGQRLTFAEFKRCFRTILRSTWIGAAIGAIPGMGQVIAAMVGYSAAKNASKHPETFGTGEIEGIAGPEAANNAVNAPTLVPLLTLGIPGDNLTAILLGAFVANGLRPGPQLFHEQGPLVFGILVAMVLANVLFLVIGYATIPLFARIVTIRKSLLLPLTVIFALTGAYAYQSNEFDIFILIFFGLFGYAARKLRFDVSPMVMGFILGPVLEYALGQTMSMSQGAFMTFIFVDRPIASAVLVATPVVTFLLWHRAAKLRREQAARSDAKR
jgi:putative tricarboxylic transport membrane protein